MSTIANYISGIRARGISATELVDDDLTLVISECLHEYSRMRPVLTETTFDTIAGQQSYTWTEIGDANGLAALAVLWNPSGGDADIFSRSHGNLVGMGFQWAGDYWDMPSQGAIDQIKNAAWRGESGGKGLQVNAVGGNVRLTPTPDQDGISVYILYTKKHDSVATIPDADRDIFLDLVEAKCADWFVKSIGKASAAMRIKTPEYEIQLGEQVDYWRKQSSEMMQRFYEKCQAGQAAAGRT
jgi:hypothetical protein